MTAWTAAVSGLERWNWTPLLSCLAMGALFGGPIGPRHGPEGRRAAERRVLGDRNPAYAHTSLY